MGQVVFDEVSFVIESEFGHTLGGAFLTAVPIAIVTGRLSECVLLQHQQRLLRFHRVYSFKV